MSHIQVKIQFHASTHPKMCDQILFETKNVTYESFYIRTICLYGKAQVLILDYQLTVKTYKSLDFGTVQWSKQGQESLVMECLKSPAPYFWPILHSRTVLPERKPKVWWQMMARYGNQLRKVIDLLEIGDSDTQISKKVKSKKKKEERETKRCSYFCNKGSPQYIGSWL